MLLGEGDFELSQYVGKIRETVDLRMTNGPLMNGLIRLQVSICPITQAHTVGVDTRLLPDVPTKLANQNQAQEEMKGNENDNAASSLASASAEENQQAYIEMTI